MSPLGPARASAAGHRGGRVGVRVEEDAYIGRVVWGAAATWSSLGEATPLHRYPGAVMS